MLTSGPRSQPARMYVDHFTGRKRCHPAMIDGHPVRRRRGDFAPIERGEGPAITDQVCAHRRRFAGEVSGVEFLEGGIDVVEVEHDTRHDPLVGVDLDDAEGIDDERLGVTARKRTRMRARRSPRVAMTVDASYREPRPRRSPACFRSRHPDRVGPRRSPPDDDRRWKKSSAIISAMASQSRAAKNARKRSVHGLPRFPAAASAG